MQDSSREGGEGEGGRGHIMIIILLDPRLRGDDRRGRGDDRRGFLALSESPIRDSGKNAATRQNPLTGDSAGAKRGITKSRLIA